MRGWLGLAASVLSWTIACCANAAVSNIGARPLLLDHLTTLDGLPQGTVYASLQDSTGFVWFATEDGLVRYDGHAIHRYAFDPGAKAGLPGNFVFKIAEDAQADLWIAIKGAGIARWNRKTDTFHTYRHEAANPQSLASDLVRTVLVDSKGRIWIGMLDAGVDVLDPHTGTIQHLRHRQGDLTSLIDDQVYALLEDRRGEVWVGTHMGIDRWDASHDRLARSGYIKDSTGLLPGQEVQQIIESADGTLWVGTFESGAYHLDYSGGVLANYRHDNAAQGALASNEVHSLLDDQSGQIWVGTADGLDSLNRASGHVVHYRHDASDPGSLSDSFVMSLYKDHAGLVWIGTRAGGVNRWNSQSWELGGRVPAWLEGKVVTAFAEGTRDHLWVGTLGGGLYDLNIGSGEASKFDTLRGRQNALGDNRVMSLLKDVRGTLWIGTWGLGVKRLDKDGHLDTISFKKGDASSLSAPGIVTMYETTDGSVWIGTHGGGANVMNRATGSIKQLPWSPDASGSTTSDNVTAFLEDRAGNVWIGSDGGGLKLARPDGTIIASFSHQQADPHSLSANTIYALSIDPDGHVWIATDGGGLNLLLGSSRDPAHIGFQRFSLEEGLSSATIYAAVPDGRGSLWLSGNAGLMRFRLADHTVKTLHREDGLQGEEFNFGAFYRMHDGQLAFGGTAGLNVFDPAQLTVNLMPPRIVLTGIEVLGVPIKGDRPNWSLHDVSLNYHASVVSFDFAALDFKSPGRNRLAYRVSGLTDKWIDLNSQRRVSLTNLGAGEHSLEVRAANADSVWSTTPYRLTIHKAAAPWASTTAFVLYGVCLLGIVAWLMHAHRTKLSHAVAAQHALEREVAARTKELSEANQQLTVASEAKSDFLARMSHELRTPMNGVVGMTELLARAALPPAQARQVSTIRSSAQTLLQILNDLLDLSKAQAGKIQLESLPLELTLLLEESVAMFAGAAEAKGLALIVCPAPAGPHEVAGDPLRVRQILMNLIGNAIKFTGQGEVVVSWDIVTAVNDVKIVRITVADTGVGISNTAITKIFDPFVQADETTTRRFGGTGLGLSICQQLVELMGGTITVDSQPHCGSTFTLLLPLELRLRDEAVARPAPTQTLVIITKRLSFGESCRRYATLLNCECRVQDVSGLESLPQNEFVLVDADSCAAVVRPLMRKSWAGRVLIMAGAGAIEEHKLESLVDEARLLRSPVPCALLEGALALASGRAVDGNPAERRAQPSRNLGKHVLIVDDDNVNAAVAEGYLAELGCTSVWVRDGASAIVRQGIECFDVILMDLNMPGLDGYETSRRIRATAAPTRRIAIIALTANNAEVFRAECLSAGMDDIMTKPYSLAQCAALITRWTEHGGAQEEVPIARPAAHLQLAAIDALSVSGFRGIGGAMKTNLYVKLVELFQATVADQMDLIGRLLDGGDLNGARGAAHKLKGAAANVGALAFSQGLGAVEAACECGDLGEAKGTFEALVLALPMLTAALQDMSVRESA